MFTRRTRDWHQPSEDPIMATDVFTSRKTTGAIVQGNGLQTAFGGLETREPLTDARIDGIARDPLAQLSLDEKIDIMSGGHDVFRGVLHVSSAGCKRHPVTTVGANPRLGIPGLRFTDGSRDGRLRRATIVIA